MTVNITDSLTFTSPIVAPTDGDPASGSTFQAGLQALANRTAFINNALTANGVSATANGVTMIRYVTTVGLLVAMTGMANNSFCYVQGYGLYQYNSTSAVSFDNVYTISGNAGIGRWFSEVASIGNVDGGLAVIGLKGATQNRIMPSLVPNGLVSVQYAATTTLPTIGTSSTEITNLTLTFAAVAGDKLHISFMVGLYYLSTAGATSCYVGASITDGASTATPLGATPTTGWVQLSNVLSSIGYISAVGHYVYTAQNTGNIVVRVVSAQTSGSYWGGSAVTSTHQILQFRP